MLTRAAARRAAEATHAIHVGGHENELMEIEECDLPSHIVEFGVQRRRQVRMEEEVGDNHRMRQVVVEEELVNLEKGAYQENMNRHAIMETQNLVVEQERRIEQRMHQLVDHNNQQVVHATEASEKRIQHLLQAQLHRSQQEIAGESSTLRQTLQVALEKAESESQERYTHLSRACESQIKALTEHVHLQGEAAALANSSIMTELKNRFEQAEAKTQASVASLTAHTDTRLKETLNDARYYTKQQVSNIEVRLQQKLDAASSTMRSETTKQVADIAHQLQLQLQTTQKRIETNARGIEARIQSKLDQQQSDGQLQTDSKLRQVEHRWHDNIETIVGSHAEIYCTMMEERLQKKLVEAHAQELDKTEGALAGMTEKIEIVAAATTELLTRHDIFENKIQHSLTQAKSEVHEYLASVIPNLGKPTSALNQGDTMAFLQPGNVATGSENQAHIQLNDKMYSTTPGLSEKRVPQPKKNQVSYDDPQCEQQPYTPVESIPLRQSGYQPNLFKDQEQQTSEDATASRLNLVEARVSAQRDVELRTRARVASLRRKAKLRLHCA
ncbi:hypothetical protein AM587_10003789 [Phytophthora nicotianae]|uniref:Uncharacterized protein n=2 Tax=Phytophthora nicotianae TaxID=4792 RepID=A0A0W8DKK2_PHYNI|nr:hypothetical protein AM587_10003789 [Phytophthora nicotianae]